MSKFALIWNGEIIDEADDLKTARYLQGEYALAYRGSVSIKRSYNRCAQCDVAIRLSADLCKDCWDAGTVEFGP